MNAVLTIDITLPFIGLIRAGTKLTVDTETLIAFNGDYHFDIELTEFNYLH